MTVAPFTEDARRYRELLESVHLVAVVMDVAGRVTFCNEFLAHLLQRPRAELIGRDWFEYCLPDDVKGPLREAFLARITDATIARTDENDIVAKNGERRTIAWNNTILRDAQGGIVGTASIGSDVTEQRRAEAQLRHLAFHDPLTGLANRSLFFARLGDAIWRVRESGMRHRYAVLFVDLDRFKIVNDSLGHGVGDELLVAVAGLLGGCVRPGDTVARLGGDEFAMLLERVNGAEEAAAVADRLQRALAGSIRLAEHEVYTTASIGIALGETTYERPEEVLRDADSAMYRAKELGKARHHLFDPSMLARAVSLLKLETDLRRALERHEFALVYQPMVELATGRAVGLEALVRWDHPERGRVNPTDFIGVAEDTGMIGPLGDWVIGEACRQAAAWLALGALPLGASVAVNLSAKQLARPGLDATIERALDAAGLPAERLELEITESVLMDNPEAAAAALRRLRGRGMRIAIDDFGTGFSSLGYLARLPIDKLKIDRVFVSRLASGAPDQAVVRTIVALGASLGMEVVAEGVESEEQRMILSALGCTRAQGFLFARPLEASEVAARVAALP
jgi:diguanylate cyclase (GGDEF)-like protein/PAS domain S-box-containing protein